MSKIEESEKNIGDTLQGIMEKIDVGRYKLHIIQELFACAPDCEGYHEPADLTLFYIGVKTILDEIMDNSNNAHDDLASLCFSDKAWLKLRQSEVTQ